ncbi:MAG TPA: hypothetical protein VEP73_02465 [Actinomycetota bacterium]|nr:hypothetical protein [Actinomycetota bacterium]
MRSEPPMGGPLRVAARAGTLTLLGLTASAGVVIGRTGRPSPTTAAPAPVTMTPAAARVGSPCARVWHRHWSARVCASVRVGRDRLGNQCVRASATARGWRWWRDARGHWRHRRRALRFAMTVRLCGPGFCQATRHRTGWARRLGIRTGWRVVVDPMPAWARARVVVTFPDGARRVVTATSAPLWAAALGAVAPARTQHQELALALAPRRDGDRVAGPRRSRRPACLVCLAKPSCVQRPPSTGFGSWAPPAASPGRSGC